MAAIKFFVYFLIFFISILSLVSSDDSPLINKCSPELTKLTVCLDYAAARSDAPTEQCCGSVSDIRDHDPACLCFMIQQVHDGTSDAIKSLGLRTDRLIQLPDACKIANSSASNCPKLLNLPSNSPDIAIFTPTKGGTTVMTGPVANNKSKGFIHQVRFGSTFALVVVSSIFLSLFSVGS